jgi:hypothetical protein
MSNERPDLILAGEENLRCALAGRLAEDDGESRYHQASSGRPQQRLALEHGAQPQRHAMEEDGQHSCGQPDDQRPAEFSYVGSGKMRQARDGEGELA